jgi:hypothetical protein
MLKLRDDWQGREMAWWLQWILLKAETRQRRGAANPQRQSCGFTLALIFCASLQRGIVQWASVSRVAANRIILAPRRRRAPRNSFGYFSLLPARKRVWLIA